MASGPRDEPHSCYLEKRKKKKKSLSDDRDSGVRVSSRRTGDRPGPYSQPTEIQHTLSEHLLSARHLARLWGHRCESHPGLTEQAFSG